MLKKELHIPRVRVEDYKVDAVFGNKDNLIYKNIDEFWPIERLVLFEHENNIGSSSEELYKLLYRRSPLKVLVTYKYQNDKDNMIDEKIKEYSKIISQSNTWFPENESTKYLFLIGKRNEENNGLIWHAFLINTRGEINQLD